MSDDEMLLIPRRRRHPEHSDHANTDDPAEPMLFGPAKWRPVLGVDPDTGRFVGPLSFKQIPEGDPTAYATPFDWWPVEAMLALDEFLWPDMTKYPGTGLTEWPRDEHGRGWSVLEVLGKEVVARQHRAVAKQMGKAA